MKEPDPDVLTVTFPLRQDEQTLTVMSELAAQLSQTQQNLAGQLARRSQHIYQSDVAAFLWWLRAHLAGETPGRYQDRERETRPASPAEAGSWSTLRYCA